MNDYRIDFDSLEWETPIEGVRQKAITRHGKRLRVVEYSRAMPPHVCEKGHFGYVLEGRLALEFPDGVRVFERGDGVFIPRGPDHRHEGKVLGETATVVFVEDA